MIPWWAAGLSLFMTTFSAWMFTGAASFAYNTGWFGILYFITTPISFLGGFLLSAKRWRRSRITSPVEYVQTRFNKVTHLFLSIMLILSLMYWPAHHLASLSKICAPTLFPNSMLAIDIMTHLFCDRYFNLYIFRWILGCLYNGCCSGYNFNECHFRINTDNIFVRRIGINYRLY